MTLEDDAIQRVRKLQEITKNTRESHKKSNKNAFEIYLRENRGATIATKEGKCSRGGRGTPEHLQRDRERDEIAAVVSRGGGRTPDETAQELAWWSRVVVDGRQTRRRKSSRGGLAWWWLEARRDCGGWMRDETAVVARGSRGGLEWWARRKSRREEETASPEFAKRNGSCAREEEGVLFLSPN
ncbi:hypothetical protein DEO72_LG9g453 [Vigna unguiculata]|uniref:Uncharacterized protein n=1 Tax=Vigna unguiculata TaxID=3917 RepID=A0A4D6MVD7_VIGUN|nr:hypothetical protein DEO72_LG9g453 [Vigna unguiculata]